MSVSALCTPSSPPRPKKIWRTGNPPDHDKRMNDDVSSEMPAEGGAESAWKKVGLVDEEVLESEREVIRSNPCSSRPSISRSTSSSGLQGGEEKEQAALEREIDGPVQVCFSQETCSALYALVPAFQEFDQKLEEESLKEVAKFKKVLDSQIESLERSKRAERRFVEVDYRDKVGQLWRRESESIRRKIWQAGLERKLLDRVLSRLDGPAGLLRRLHEDLNCLVEGSESGDELASLSSRSSTCSSNLSSSASRSPSSSPSPSASSSSSVKSGERATTIRELSVASDDGMTRHGETNSVSFLFDLHRLRRVPYQRVGMSFPEGKSGRGIKLMASEARIRKDFEMMGIKTLPFDRVLPGEDERVQHPAFLPLATTTTTLSTRREEDSKAAAEALLQVSGGFLQVGTSVGVEKGKSRQEDQSTSRSWECLLMASTMLAGGEVEEVEVEGDFDVGSRGFETLTKGLGRSTRSSAGDQVFDAEENSDSDSVRLGQGSNGSNGEIQGGVREDGLARGSFEGMRSDEFDGSSTSGVSSVGNDPGRTQDRSSESIMTPPLPKVKKEPRDGAAALVSEEDRYTASAEDAVGEESGKNSLRRSPRIRKSRELYSPKDRRVVSSVSNQSTNVAVERGNGTGNGNGFEMDDARVAKRSLSRRDTNGRSSENGSPRGREGKRKRGDGRDPHGTGPGMEEQGGQEEEDAEEDAEEEEIGFDLPSTGEEGDRRKRRRKDPGSNEGGSRPAESRPSSSSSSSSSSPTTSFRRSESNPPSNSRHERKEEKKRKRSEPPTAPPERMEIERGKPPPPVRIDELKNRPVPPAASGGGGIRWWKKGNPTNTTTTTSTENRRKG
ncbi:hypothetical protein IE53DRAFT_254806 [Violaceomyces palustris]|uniref:Uncharacterized protein n=1 Tax=Violaceomyces palustris TaxID=1673888 RepID=A0ACD0NNI2_9BASI|nr:hypothetical protein IE53DRAFT_254806 [Violaceomyces palustris]